MRTIKCFFLTVTIIWLSTWSALAQDITVAAAANLQAILPKLVEMFKKESGINVKTIYGSSGKLTAQIENGAPFDLFLSADMKYPQALYKEGLTLQEPQVYAYGTLVLWSTRKMDLSKGMQRLKEADIKRIAIANPQLAPYGRESINALKFYNLYPRVQKKLVYGESISQANDFIVSQSADIGFTAKSTVLSPNLKEKGTWIDVPRESYHPIAQGAVILKRAQKNNLDAAQKFYNFIFSVDAQHILMQYGYGVDK